MAKRPQKRSARSEEDNLGCMRGLISVFDFRQSRSTQKLLPDRKHGSDTHVGSGYSRSKFDLVRNLDRKREDVIASISNFNDVDGKEAGRIGLGTTSIKILMEEEMSSAHPSKKPFSPEVERVKPDFGFGGNLEKNHKQRDQNYKVASDHHANDSRASVNKSGQSNCADKSEKPYFDLDLATLMVEINHQYQEKQIDFKKKIDPFPPLISSDHRKDNHHDKPDVQLIQKHSILQQAQCDVTKTSLTQKSIVAKQLTGNVKLHQSKELMDALESPNLNKELFVKLLQDPDLLHDLQNAQAGKFSELKSCKNLEGSELIGEEIGSSGKREELVSRKLFHMQNAFSWKKNKSKGTKPSKGSGSGSGSDSPLTSNRIVVLKPNAARNQNPSILISPGSSPRSDYRLQHEEGTKRVASHFSLKEIKRRLSHAIGENRNERLLIAMDGVLHRIPHESKDSGDMHKKGARESVGTGLTCKTYCAIEHAAHPSPSAKREDKKTKSKECQTNMELAAAYAKIGNQKKLSMEAVAHPLYRESVFYEEAKQHLAEMLNTGGQNETSPTSQVPKTLGRLLSFPGYNLLSPRLSPGRDKEPDSPQKMRSSPVMQFKQETATDQLSLLKQDIKSSSWTGTIRDDEPQVLDSNPALFDIHVQSGKELIPKESMETIEAADQSDCLIVNEPGIASERCKEEGSTSLSGLGPTEERPQLMTSSVSILPSSAFIQKLDVPEILMEIPERPSPVSVLEPFFLDDINSPVRTIEQAEYSVQPRRIHFEEQENYEVVLASSDSEANRRTYTEDKEAKFEYVRALLEASGMSYNKLSKRWHLSDQLLDPFLFDEVEISSSHLPDDLKLLFDCTNEVLVGIWERLFGCTPWLSIIRPNVWPILVGGNLIQEVCKVIDWHLHSHFPCTIDQAVREELDCGNWVNLRCETENSVFEMGDAILEYLMEETVLELWD